MINKENNNFGLNISIINRTAQSYFFHKLKPFKIGPGQQAYLLALLPDETIIQDELAIRLNIDKANVSRAVSNLEKLGYISRESSEDDKRIKLLTLTTKGIKARSEIEKIAAAWIDTIKSSISTTEWKNLNVGLKLLADALMRVGD